MSFQYHAVEILAKHGANMEATNVFNESADTNVEDVTMLRLLKVLEKAVLIIERTLNTTTIRVLMYDFVQTLRGKQRASISASNSEVKDASPMRRMFDTIP